MKNTVQTNEMLIKKYLLERVGRIMKAPQGKLKHPFLDPGACYGGEQWDWDSCFEAQGLFSAFEIFSEDELNEHGITREKVSAHAKGCILNFLEAQEEDGYIPILVCSGGLFEGYFEAEHQKGKPMNPAKMFCTAVYNACKFVGDYTWFRVDGLLSYLDYYERNLYDEVTGLFFFQDDIMVGIDNNPTVFYRNPRSSADIFLNCMLYKEYCVTVHILRELQDVRAQKIQEKAEMLKEAVIREMWDEHDGLFYSQDLTRYDEVRKVKDVAFHSGLHPTWHCTPLKIRFWACFMPMWAGLCTREQAERMCEHLRANDDILTKYGIRTCAKTEKMYSLEKSSNPSNWLGAVWVMPNVLIWQGLVRYEQMDMAEQLRTATLGLIGKNLKELGDMFESYHPDTGEPMLNPGYLGLNMPVMEMLLI